MKASLRPVARYNNVLTFNSKTNTFRRINENGGYLWLDEKDASTDATNGPTNGVENKVENKDENKDENDWIWKMQQHAKSRQFEREFVKAYGHMPDERYNENKLTALDCYLMVPLPQWDLCFNYAERTLGIYYAPKVSDLDIYGHNGFMDKGEITDMVQIYMDLSQLNYNFELNWDYEKSNHYIVNKDGSRIRGVYKLNEKSEYGGVFSLGTGWTNLNFKEFLADTNNDVLRVVNRYEPRRNETMDKVENGLLKGLYLYENGYCYFQDSNITSKLIFECAVSHDCGRSCAKVKRDFLIKESDKEDGVSAYPCYPAYIISKIMVNNEAQMHRVKMALKKARSPQIMMSFKNKQTRDKNINTICHYYAQMKKGMKKGMKKMSA